MSTARPSNLVWVPFFTLIKREIKRFMKVAVQTVLTPMITASLYLLIFGVSLGSHITLTSGVSYLAFLIPGLVMMGCLNNAFQNSSSSIVISKFSGDLEDLKIAPITNQQILWAMGVGGLFRGAFVGFVTLVVAEVFYYFSEGLVLGIQHPLILTVFLIFGGLAFAFLGLSTAFWAKNFDQLAAVNSFILLPLIYLGGVFFSIESLHPFWRSVAALNPLVYFINGVRYGFLGISDVDPLLALAVSGITMVVLYVTAYFSLKRASFIRW
ncbi:MAG: ABC transporter permease [Bdellovibrionota bacterium]